jgi:glycosyltransferase involved in cell wall biosynthesis
LVKSKIYFIAPFPPPVTGAATMAEELAKTITQSGAGEVYCFNISMNKITGSTSQYVKKTMKLLMASWKIATGSYDYLVIIPPGGAMLAMYFPVMAAARSRGIRIVFDHHNYSYINRSHWMMAFASWIMGAKGLHLFLSDKMGRQFSERYYTQQWKSASNWGRLKFDGAKNGRVGGVPLTLGFLSNVTLEKGIDTFLCLLELLVQRDAKVRAIVAGGLDADAKPLIDAAVEKGLPIEALGPLYGLAKAEFLAACDVLALPTRYGNEAEPLVLIEGQLAGCFIVATDIGTIAETICPGNGFAWPGASFLTEAVDLVERFASQTEKMRADRDRLSQTSAQRAAQERLAWKHVVTEIIA